MGPHADHVEVALNERRAAQVPLQFSARGFRNRAVRRKNHRSNLDAVRFVYGIPYGCDGPVVPVKICESLRRPFQHNDKLLGSVSIDRKCGAAISSNRWISLRDGVFDILRIMFVSTNVDNVFDASCDKEMAVADKSEIAGSQEGSIVAAGEVCTESGLGFSGPLPIAFR